MKKSVKKYLILSFLFFFPIFIYIFFASGINNFARLPILTTNVLDIQSINGNLQGISLKDNISILGFWGGDVNLRKSEALNLNQKIYRRFSQFQDFQFVFLTTKDQETNINNLKEELIRGVGTDLEKWNFIFTDEKEIQKIYNSLKTDIELSGENSTPYVFIIDRDLNLRGRDDDDDIGKLYGFNAESVAEINNKMVDDVKIILAEYRLALKKNDSLFK
ncbi:MAG TPA: hypothetical protein QF428_05635 [Flavobacteriaceae bacterium]|jgi:hypothetical protein|nr:hypothetical protein [Flavobacteriaceae bacterium]HJO71187.1 hypothetical protein [Flavobacteriaceae bacterium]|tara:strand:- start:3165 stop:3821 length:657 start_codon:yes stop_codon:yes gene_type:complete